MQVRAGRPFSAQDDPEAQLAAIVAIFSAVSPLYQNIKYQRPGSWRQRHNRHFVGKCGAVGYAGSDAAGYAGGSDGGVARRISLTL